MNPITSPQAFDLADAFRRSGESLTRRLLESWPDLSPAERADMQRHAEQLLALAITTRVRAMGLSLDGAETSLTALKRATARANAAIRSAESARQSIRTAAAVLTLAGAVASQRPAAVVGALVDLTDLLDA